jgi:hypothetical protein
MAKVKLPPALERRAIKLTASKKAALSEARNILADGNRLLGLQKTIEIFDRSGLDVLALAVCLHPMPLPEKYTTARR